MIGCEDRLRNDLYCVGWGVELYSNQTKLGLAKTVLLTSLSTPLLITEVAQHPSCVCMCQLRVYSMQPSEPRPAVYLFTGCTPYPPARLQPASRARRAQQMRGPLCSLRSNRRRISWELTPSRLHAARGLHPCTPARRRDCYTLSCGDGQTDGRTDEARERQRVYDLWAAQRSLMCDRPRPSVRER